MSLQTQIKNQTEEKDSKCLLRGPPGFVGLGLVNTSCDDFEDDVGILTKRQSRGPPGFVGLGTVNPLAGDDVVGSIVNIENSKRQKIGSIPQSTAQPFGAPSTATQPPKTKIYLNVKFHEKDDAKLLGAMWDKDAKKWFAFSNCQSIDILKQKYLATSGNGKLSSGVSASFSAASAFTMSPVGEIAQRSPVGEIAQRSPVGEIAQRSPVLVSSTSSFLSSSSFVLADSVPPIFSEEKAGEKYILDRIYLGVNFTDKENAKLLGAMWDTTVSKWYVSSKAPNATLLADKYPIHSAPVILTGEDRNFGGNQLFVDLVPKGCSFTNCRFNVDACDFDRLFNHVIGRASFTCECCGFESKDNLAHFKIAERWSFDDETKTQKLMRLLCVCENCHKSIHMSKKDKIEASAHLQQICGFSSAETNTHVQAAFALWGRRNSKTWILDLTLLLNNGIKLAYSNQ
jgi:hypothetical protein